MVCDIIFYLFTVVQPFNNLPFCRWALLQIYFTLSLLKIHFMCQFLVTRYEEKYITSINCYFDISSQSEHNNVHLNTVHPLVDTLSDFSQQNESFNA